MNRFVKILTSAAVVLTVTTATPAMAKPPGTVEVRIRGNVAIADGTAATGDAVVRYLQGGGRGVGVGVAAELEEEGGEAEAEDDELLEMCPEPRDATACRRA